MDENKDLSGTQQPDAQPAEKGEQGAGKLFTQAEVDNIIRERLARERAKNAPQEPTEEEKRAKDLSIRENRLSCREYVMENRLPAELLDVLDTSDHEKFIKNAEKLSGLLRENQPATRGDSALITEIRRRVAREELLPDVLASRLTGETEDEIRADAREWHRIVNIIQGPAPLFHPASETGGWGNDLASAFQRTPHTPKTFPPGMNEKE